ncbi:MAG: phospholipase D-like domain-containing protein [Ferruginibacter sp.]
MTSQGYFEDIKTHLDDELKKANHHILVAVAWFTDTDLFSTLLSKVKNGIIVEVMYYDDKTNMQYSVDFTKLEKAGAKIYRLGDENTGTIMHNKFCIIDLKTVINGSYNWTRNATTNHENITVSWDAKDLAIQFANEFQRLKEKYYNNEKAEKDIDISKIVKRLEIIKSLISLEEPEDIPLQILRLKHTQLNDELVEIVEELQKRNYSAAMKMIEGFVQRYKQVAIFIDPETAGLKLEAKSLEIQLNALSDEYEEIEKLLNNFTLRHTQELGSLILQILEFKKAKAITEHETKEAEEDLNSYRKEFENKKNQILIQLNEEEQREIKKLYRAASFLCHPDVAKGGEQWFIALNNAYELNNLNKVKEILHKLETGQPLETNSQKTKDKYLLQELVKSLRIKIKDLIVVMEKIKESSEYKTIIGIKDWDEYFITLRIQLQQQLNELENE